MKYEEGGQAPWATSEARPISRDHLRRATPDLVSLWYLIIPTPRVLFPVEVR
jgi:hypothetical protein